MEHKKSKLTLKGIDESTGIPFIKEIHSLDEVKTSGTYIVIARNATSEENGFPKIHSKTDSCFCCEANLVVNCCYNDDESQSSNTYGQELTISDKENNNTGTYKRTVGPAGCSEWLMVATGSIKLVAQNNDIVKAYNEVSANLNAALERIDKAEDTVSKSHNTVLESATVRFDRIEENEATINAGEIDSTPTAIVYYKPANKFVAADSSGAYWDSWSNMEAYMSGSSIRKDKLYLCNGEAYIVISNILMPISDTQILSGITDILYPELIKGSYCNLSKLPGEVITDSFIEHPSYGCLKTKVEKGDVIRITTIGAVNARAYALTDKNNILLENADENKTLENFTLSVYKDGWLYVNCKVAGYKIFKIEILKSIKDAVNSIYRLSNVCGYELVKSQYWDLSGKKVPSAAWDANDYSIVKEILVKEGDTFTITTTGGLNARAYGLTDRERNIIEVAEPNTSYKHHTITAPVDGYLFVNCRKNEYFYLVKNFISEKLSNVEKKLNSAIQDTERFYISDIVAGYYNLNKSVGEIAPLTPYEHEKWKCLCIEVTPADLITLTTTGGETGRAYALTDSERIILNISEANATLSDFQIPISEKGYLYINCSESGFETFKLYIAHNKIDMLENRVTAMEGKKNPISLMYNPIIDLQKPSLKILDIGNSYTVDSQSYVGQLIAATGEDADISLYSAVRGGASFKTWYDCYNDMDTYDSYSIGKKYGIELDGIAGSIDGKDGSLFRNALQSVKWDIILIHQVSSYANDFSVWEGNSDGGYLKEFIQIIRKTNPQASIGFLLVHSYRSTFSSNKEGSSLLRWQNIVNATKEFKQKYGIDFIIPYGTAVQNLRASSLSDANEFSTDGTHLAEGLGDYVASCCYYQSLIAPRIGISVFGNTFRTTGLDESIAGVKNITDDTAVVAQKAAMLATYNMWDVMNPDEW